MPSTPNFMCTGLVTVAPLFGSMKNTRTFLAPAFFIAGFLACADAPTPNPTNTTSASSVSCLLTCICKSPFRDILAEPSSKPSTSPSIGQTTARGLPTKHAIGNRLRERGIHRSRDERDTSTRGDLARVGSQLGGDVRRETGAYMFEQQDRWLERQRASKPQTHTRIRIEAGDRIVPYRLWNTNLGRDGDGLRPYIFLQRLDLECEWHGQILEHRQLIQQHGAFADD